MDLHMISEEHLQRRVTLLTCARAHTPIAPTSRSRPHPDRAHTCPHLADERTVAQCVVERNPFPPLTLIHTPTPRPHTNVPSPGR
eukprot:181861-Chlamydomonas_euryale.AAC.1